MKSAFEILGQAYLDLLILSRSNPGFVPDSALATLRDEIAKALGADVEYVQNSFELVADAFRR